MPTHSPLPWQRIDYSDPFVSIFDAAGGTVAVQRYRDSSGRAVADFDLICTAVNCHADLLAACEAVAAFDDCEDAADWKDAYARLVRGCVAAVRNAKGGAA